MPKVGMTVQVWLRKDDGPHAGIITRVQPDDPLIRVDLTAYLTVLIDPSGVYRYGWVFYSLVPCGIDHPEEFPHWRPIEPTMIVADTINFSGDFTL